MVEYKWPQTLAKIVTVKDLPLQSGVIRLMLERGRVKYTYQPDRIPDQDLLEALRGDYDSLLPQQLPYLAKGIAELVE